MILLCQLVLGYLGQLFVSEGRGVVRIYGVCVCDFGCKGVGVIMSLDVLVFDGCWNSWSM